MLTNIHNKYTLSDQKQRQRIAFMMKRLHVKKEHDELEKEEDAQGLSMSVERLQNKIIVATCGFIKSPLVQVN